MTTRYFSFKGPKQQHAPRHGTVVNLPCRVESHLLPSASEEPKKRRHLQNKHQQKVVGNATLFEAQNMFFVFRRVLCFSMFQALYKSADVAQMLIVHREDEVPNADRPDLEVVGRFFQIFFHVKFQSQGSKLDTYLLIFSACWYLSGRYLDKKTFTWKSGITPPTQLVVDRRFRGVAPTNWNKLLCNTIPNPKEGLVQ